MERAEKHNALKDHLNQSTMTLHESMNNKMDKRKINLFFQTSKSSANI